MSNAAAAAATPPLVIGRYALFDELAAGGMATVHLGRLLGPVGFSRTVAVKRLHAHYLKDQEFITMFMDEARIVARIRHPNVVPMVDVVQCDKGLFLVMEYVHGESLSKLMRNARKANELIPPRIVTAIMCGVLLGLHAAHETKGPDGQLLGVVHRDVSPQNVIVGVDGTARVLDFGIAKAAGRAQVTREGQIKGKLAYMAPEQIRGQVDRRTDVFAAAVVLWEMLAGRRLHEGMKDVDIVTRVVQGKFPPPSHFRPELGPELDAIVMRGLASDPKKRFDSARDLALELERHIGLASPTEVSEWVERHGHEVLSSRSELVSAMELASGDLIALESNPPPPSLAMANVPSMPRPAPLPSDLDRAHPNGEVPSSSAVFAHAQTAPNVTAEGGAPRPASAVVWAMIGICAALAIIGAVLGTYALMHHSSANPGRSTPSATSPTIAPTAVPAPTATGAVSASATATATAIPNEDKPTPTTPPSANAATTTTTSTAAPTTPGVVKAAGPLPTASQPRKTKPSCEPPYTLDDVGHRHYKPECMGMD